MNKSRLKHFLLIIAGGLFALYAIIEGLQQVYDIIYLNYGINLYDIIYFAFLASILVSGIMLIFRKCNLIATISFGINSLICLYWFLDTLQYFISDLEYFIYNADFSDVLWLITDFLYMFSPMCMILILVLSYTKASGAIKYTWFLPMSFEAIAFVFSVTQRLSYQIIPEIISYAVPETIYIAAFALAGFSLIPDGVNQLKATRPVPQYYPPFPNNGYPNMTNTVPNVAPTPVPTQVSNVVPGNTTPTTADDKTTEIRNYKKLLDDGIITQEEFEAKKRQLLGL